MTTLGDPALWRTAPHSADVFCYISRPATVFAARVNAPSGVTYPITSLPYDTITTGAYGDILPGMTLLLGSTAGAWDRGIQRVRAAASASEIPVGRSSRGELVGELRVVDNDYVTVIEDYRLWARTPRIDGIVLYKDENVYSDSLALAPVVRLGSDLAGRVDATTGLLTVSFTDNSYTQVGTIASRLWDVGDGTITVGVATDASITATFPIGERYVSLAVTDSSGYTSTGRRLIAAVDRTVGNAYAAIPVELGTITRRPEGVDAEITVKGSDLAQTTYYPGVKVLVFFEEHYGATSGSLNDATRGSVKFNGWLETEIDHLEAARQGLRREVTLQLADLGKRLTQIPKFADVLLRKTTATTWNHIKAAKAHLNGAAIHYLANNTTALAIADLQRFSDAPLYTFSLLDGQKGNAYEQVDFVAKAMRCRLTVNSRGQLKLAGYPNYQPTTTQVSNLSLSVAGRTATEIVTLQESDLYTLEYTHEQPPGVHWINGSAILVSTQEGDATTRTDTPLFALAPGSAPGQGSDAQDAGQQLATEQNELNCVEGHRYKVNNAKQGTLNVQLTRGGDAGIEPADMEWVLMNLSSSYAAQRGITFTNKRCLPVEQRFEFGRHGVVYQYVTLEPEQIGQPAITVTVTASAAPTTPTPSSSIPPISVSVAPSPAALLGIGNLAMLMANGTLGNQNSNLATSASFDTPAVSGGPDWTNTDINASLDGFLLDVEVDAYSPLYLGTGSTVNVWAVTHSKLYYIEDIFGTPVYNLKHTFAASTNYRTVRTERGFQNQVIVISNYGAGGAKLLHSTDNTTFTETAITANASAGGRLAVPFGHLSGYVSGQVFVGAFNASGDWRLFSGNIGGGAPTFTDITPAGVTGTENFYGIFVPFTATNDDSVWYWGQYDASGSTVKLYKHTAAGDTDITPVFNSVAYAPMMSSESAGTTPHRHCFSVCNSDPNTILAIALSQGTPGEPVGDLVVCFSRTGGASWTQLTTPVDNVSMAYLGCAMSGSRNLGYLYGRNGTITVVTFNGTLAAFDSRLGDLVTTQAVLNIFGG